MVQAGEVEAIQIASSSLGLGTIHDLSSPPALSEGGQKAHPEITLCHHLFSATDEVGAVANLAPDCNQDQDF